MDVSGPQTSFRDNGPMVVSREQGEPALILAEGGQQKPWVQCHEARPVAEGAVHNPDRTVCGLRVATFVLGSLLALVTIIAAVGGGVGGTMAVNRARRYVLQGLETEATVSAASIVTTTVTASPKELSLQLSYRARGPQNLPSYIHS